MKELVIDVRKLFDSGIGAYIWNVVPRVVNRLRNRTISLLYPASWGEREKNHLQLEDINWIKIKHKPFTIGEQWEFRQLIGPECGFWATSLSHPLFPRLPLIATVHDVAQLALGREGGSLMTRALCRLYFRSLSTSATLLMPNSQFTHDEFARYIGFRGKAHVIVIPLGVDDSWLRASSIPRLESLPARYFLFLGNLRPHKNLRRVLAAFKNVMHAVPHDLVIVGRHEGFRTGDSGIVGAINTIGHRVHFLGELPTTELKSCVANADALVFPSLYEGFGLPVVEALAAGCIVMTSNVGVVPELCDEAAFIVDPRCTSAIETTMVRVANLPSEERERRRRTGIARAKHFSWDRTAELTADEIDKAIVGNHRTEKRGSKAMITNLAHDNTATPNAES